MIREFDDMGLADGAAHSLLLFGWKSLVGLIANSHLCFGPYKFVSSMNSFGMGRFYYPWCCCIIPMVSEERGG